MCSVKLYRLNMLISPRNLCDLSLQNILCKILLVKCSYLLYKKWKGPGKILVKLVVFYGGT